MSGNSLKKPYASHELAYQTMRRQGIRQWGGRGSGTKGSFSHETKQFLKDALSQPWVPTGGRAIELGCGTGPILRWLCGRGFAGLGLDISKTAIAMAKEQTPDAAAMFRCADVCRLNTDRLGRFDLVVDGHCLHCITSPKDRHAYLSNACRLLKPGGVFILMTMCAPIDRVEFKKTWKGMRLYKKIVYCPFSRDERYEQMRMFNGRPYLAHRYIAHWQDLLSDLRKAGLGPKLIRYNACNYNDAAGTLTVAAMKSPAA